MHTVTCLRETEAVKEENSSKCGTKQSPQHTNRHFTHNLNVNTSLIKTDYK